MNAKKRVGKIKYKASSKGEFGKREE